MSSVVPFEFHGSEVRTLMGEDQGVWFVATDIALALDYRDASNMVRNLDDDEADTHIVSIRSENGVEQDRSVTIINESGLYNAIFGSRKASAKAFRKWVTSEVLPTIRKTGTYTRGEDEAVDPFMATVTALEELDRALRVATLSQQQRVNLIRHSLRAQNVQYAQAPDDLIDLALASDVVSLSRVDVRSDIEDTLTGVTPMSESELIDALGDDHHPSTYLEELDAMVVDGTVSKIQVMDRRFGGNGWASCFTV